MSKTPSPEPSTETPVPQPPAEAMSNPDAMVAWATTPEGQEFFRRAGMKLMEERVNAERDGRPAPVATSLSPASTLSREDTP